LVAVLAEDILSDASRDFEMWGHAIRKWRC
jgi:hypothetical protein